MQQPGPDLPHGTVPGALRSDSKTLFGLHLYLVGRCWKIPNVPEVLCNVSYREQ